MPYMTLRNHWSHIIVLNVHAPTEDKIDYVKDSFYEQLKPIFHKYHMNILLGEFNAKEGREDTFKPTNGNENLHEISNNNGVVNFCHISKSHCQKCDVPTSQHS
jgi:hypothetical protein